MTVQLHPGAKGSDRPLRPGTRRRAGRYPGAAMAWLLAAVLMAGCAGAPELGEAAAGKFQARVATAKQLAVEQNFAGALAELEQLRSDVQVGAEQGDVSPQRRSRIEASIDKVRADLEAAVAAARPEPAPTTAAPEPSPEEEEDEEKAKEKEVEEEDRGKGENKGKGKDD